MALMAKDSGGSTNFADVPAGLHPSVCADVVDLGIQETPFQDPKTGKNKRVHQCKLVWLVNAEDEDGEPVRNEDGTLPRLSKYYTVSLHEKANLRKDLDRWRGKAFTDEELAEGWDIESVIGAPALLSVIRARKAKDGEEFAKVDAVLKAQKNTPKVQVDPDYTREKDRPGGKDIRSPKEDASGGNGGDYSPPESDEDDDLPF